MSELKSIVEALIFASPEPVTVKTLTKLLDTVARFIERGGTLTIDAKPQPPIDLEGFKPLMKPGADLVRLLGLSATLSR